MLDANEARPITRRLSETPEPATARAAELLNRLPRPPELSPAAFLRIGERLAMPQLPRPLWQWAVAGTAAVGVAVLAAVWVPRLAGRGHDQERPEPAVQQRPLDREVQRPAVIQPVVTPLLPEPQPTPPPPAPEPAATRPPAHPPARPARPSAPLPPAPPERAPVVESESGLAAESRMLGVALHQLRQERDGAATLRSLDAYQQRFPSGLLAEEAQAARVDALLLMEHKDQALQLLEHTQFQRLGRGGELRVVRGELRAAAGRCREALSDFAAVLATSAAPPVAERALYGQASCLAQLADTHGARAHLEQYLTRFPSGRFAEAARRALQTLPATP